MNTDQVYIWIGVIIVGAVIAYLLGHKKGTANVAAATPPPATVGTIASAVTAIKDHVTAAVSGLESKVVSGKPPAPAAAATNLLQNSYASAAALKAAITTLKINYMVTLDSFQINPGFGPPQQFFTQGDGSVSTSRPAAANAAPAAPAAPVPAPPIESSTPVATTSAVRNQYESCNFTDKLVASSCALADELFIAKMDMPFRILVGAAVKNAQLQFCILSGSQAAINGVMSNVYNNHEPEIAKFNVSTYTGPLKGRYDSLVAGIEAGTVTAIALYSDTGTTTSDGRAESLSAASGDRARCVRRVLLPLRAAWGHDQLAHRDCGCTWASLGQGRLVAARSRVALRLRPGRDAALRIRDQARHRARAASGRVSD